jgi:hypothetical protein
MYENDRSQSPAEDVLQQEQPQRLLLFLCNIKVALNKYIGIEPACARHAAWIVAQFPWHNGR